MADINSKTSVRIDELEVRLAQQDHSIEALSDEVYRQQQQIAQLEVRVRRLIERLELVAPVESSEDPADEVPPHY